MRKQVFGIFKELGSSKNALRQLQRFPFDGKPIQIQYAKINSDVISKTCVTFADKEENNAETVRQTAITDKPGQVTPTSSNTQGNATSHSQVPDYPPNFGLFLNNFSEETNKVMFPMLFNQFPGFKEVCVVPERHDITFVEFEIDGQAGILRDVSQGFKITLCNATKITYAKK